LHPAISVIFFTTASGAGYGLLAVLGIAAPAGLLPTQSWLGLSGLGLALALISAGLLSSTFHLGHPERAWRAVSQWRSSWLSREGVVALATYVPAGLFAIGWVFLGTAGGIWALFGLLRCSACYRRRAPSPPSTARR
jgi:DMSO reductase anchor subunit